jgi:hypothetical protein
MHNSRYTIPFLDCLFVLLLGTISLLFIALLHINPPTKENDIPTRAELIITMEWDDESNDDVDIWIQNLSTKNGGFPVFFSRASDGIMHLDRDDLGTANDTVLMPDGSRRVIRVNREIVTFRGTEMDARYALNVHMYARRSWNIPAEVRVTIAVLNPSYEIKLEKKVTLERTGDETTICIFEILNGEIVEIDEVTQMAIAGPILRNVNSIQRQQ